jgi:hypothetical protein
MLQHFRIIPFLVGCMVGGLMFFFYKPPPSIVYEYPHPDNVKNRVYSDKNKVCYKYNAQEVDCNANESTIKQYPMQY